MDRFRHACASLAMVLRRVFTILSFVTLSVFALSSEAATVLVFGDSISAGYGIPQGRGWVDLLSQQLTPKHQVVNASISGETTGGGKSRLSNTLKQVKPDVVILELGGNDGLRGYPPPLIKANLNAMVALCLEADSQVILAGMELPPNYGRRYTRAFHQTFLDVAAAHSVSLIPFLLDGIATQHKYMQSDGIHPNTAAQRKLLQQVLPVLQPLLE